MGRYNKMGKKGNCLSKEFIEGLIKIFYESTNK